MTYSPDRRDGLATSAERSASAALGRIEQRTTRGPVADAIRAAILDGSFPAGSQLREAHLAADLGVSRAPLREALGTLVDEGLVVKIPFRGAFVAETSEKGIAEIASLRRRIEPYAIELAQPSLRGDGRRRVDDALTEMTAGADANDHARTVDAHMSFHRSFYELSNHSLLLGMWKSWESQLQLFLSADHQRFANLHDVVAEHERLMRIIETEDRAAIAREIDRHVHG